MTGGLLAARADGSRPGQTGWKKPFQETRNPEAACVVWFVPSCSHWKMNLQISHCSLAEARGKPLRQKLPVAAVVVVLVGVVLLEVCAFLLVGSKVASSRKSLLPLEVVGSYVLADHDVL